MAARTHEQGARTQVVAARINVTDARMLAPGARTHIQGARILALGARKRDIAARTPVIIGRIYKNKDKATSVIPAQAGHPSGRRTRRPYGRKISTGGGGAWQQFTVNCSLFSCVMRKMDYIDGEGARKNRNIMKYRNLILIVILVASCLLAGSTGKIKGKIVNSKTGEPLKGIGLYLFDIEENLISSESTDINGEFFMLDVTPGIYTLKSIFMSIYYEQVAVDSIVVFTDSCTVIDYKLNPAADTIRADSVHLKLNRFYLTPVDPPIKNLNEIVPGIGEVLDSP